MWHRPPQLIWKVIEWVMDKRLEVIALHDSDSDSLHGCCNGRGTGTAVILLGKSETGGGQLRRNRDQLIPTFIYREIL